jgi:hypothetical protein
MLMPINNNYDSGVSILDSNHANLLAYWTMENISGGVLYDETANSYDLTVVGATQKTTSFGNALLFDGDGDHCSIASGILPNSDFAVSFWMMVNDSGTEYSIFSRGEEGESIATNLAMSYIKSGGNLGFFTETGSGDNHTYDLGVQPDFDSSLHHYILNVGSSTLDLWKDNTKIVDGTSITNSDTTAARFVLGANASASTPYNVLNGALSKVRVFDRKVTDGEVSTLFNEITPYDGILDVGHPNLKAFYNFTNISGSTLLDSSLNSRNGTITGATQTVQSWGHSLDFDGSGDRVVINHGVLPNDNFAVSFWQQKSSAPTAREVIFGRGSQGESVATNINRLSMIANDNFEYFTETGSGSNHIYDLGDTPTFDSSYHHYVLNIDSGSLDLWEDNTKIVSATSVTVSDTTSGRFLIGSDPSRTATFELLTASLGLMRVFDSPLSDAEIEDLFDEITP